MPHSTLRALLFNATPASPSDVSSRSDHFLQYHQHFPLELESFPHLPALRRRLSSVAHLHVLLTLEMSRSFLVLAQWMVKRPAQHRSLASKRRQCQLQHCRDRLVADRAAAHLAAPLLWLLWLRHGVLYCTHTFEPIVVSKSVSTGSKLGVLTYSAVFACLTSFEISVWEQLDASAAPTLRGVTRHRCEDVELWRIVGFEVCQRKGPRRHRGTADLSDSPAPPSSFSFPTFALHRYHHGTYKECDLRL